MCCECLVTISDQLNNYNLRNRYTQNLAKPGASTNLNPMQNLIILSTFSVQQNELFSSENYVNLCRKFLLLKYSLDCYTKCRYQYKKNLVCLSKYNAIFFLCYGNFYVDYFLENLISFQNCIFDLHNFSTVFMIFCKIYRKP